MLEIGEIFEGKVTGITHFGAFVSLPEDKSGMVHISEVSNTYVSDISQVLQIGQDVKVKLVGINELGKISLSIKQAEPKIDDNSNQMQQRPRRNNSRANVWQGQKVQENQDMSFEDMMSKFKQTSEEKFSSLKKSANARNGGHNSRRGGKNQ